jgi:hypothetical protein
MSTKRTKHSQRRKKQTKPRANRWNQIVDRSSTLSRPLIAPDELDARLVFRKYSVLSNGAAPIAAATFNPNAAYDVDPTVGSTETYGFDEYAALYSYYRVVAYDYDVSFTNSHGYPCMVFAMNTNITLPGTNYGLYTTNPYCHSRLMAPYGGAPTTVRFRGRVPVSKLAGTPAAETADSFRAVTTGNPTDLTWLTIAAEAIQGTDLQSVGYDIKITMHVRFYSREVDLTLSGLTSRMQKIKTSREELNLQKKKKLQQ